MINNSIVGCISVVLNLNALFFYPRGHFWMPVPRSIVGILTNINMVDLSLC